MVVGHTKFASDLLISLTARDFYASDVFNERKLIAVMERHASVVLENGRIVQAWREMVSQKSIATSSRHSRTPRLHGTMK